jgi:hypothetical protein
MDQKKTPNKPKRKGPEEKIPCRETTASIGYLFDLI